MTAYRIVCHHVETYISHFFLFAGRVCVVTVPALKQTDLIKRLELNQINKQNHTDQSESYTDNSNSVNYFSVLCWSLTLHAVFDKNRNPQFFAFFKKQSGVKQLRLNSTKKSTKYLQKKKETEKIN